jgi:hypothetical protein
MRRTAFMLAFTLVRGLGLRYGLEGQASIERKL